MGFQLLFFIHTFVKVNLIILQTNCRTIKNFAVCYDKMTDVKHITLISILKDRNSCVFPVF